MERTHIGFIVIAAGDPGLVGDDKHIAALIIRSLDCGFGAIDPPEILMPVGVSLINVQDTVAIEKGRRTAEELLPVGSGKEEVLRNSDIDKRTLILEPL